MPERGLIELHGSFARTGMGHGTDRALVGGLLGIEPDDGRLRTSLDLAADAGLEVEFGSVKLRGEDHPNTVRLTLERAGRSLTITASSVGAGRIVVTAIDGYPVEISGHLVALVFVAADEPGIVARASGVLARDGENIATMRASRRRRGGDAIHVYELDGVPSTSAVEGIAALDGVRWARVVDRVA